jgi:hypothetical protein
MKKIHPIYWQLIKITLKKIITMVKETVYEWNENFNREKKMGKYHTEIMKLKKMMEMNIYEGQQQII